ncbi:hypothetical protein HK102_001707 [Quaeritorhiza haematococci]|nr:hypothetical protein HK102_001707 [Quaeritorhiza haematococci]
MILNSRHEILVSFQGLASQNTEISSEIDAITYDESNQTAMADLNITINPKALGGLLPIRIHQIIKLALEPGDGPIDSHRLFVVRHDEVHVTQKYISQVPIVGSWYDGTIRQAMGKLAVTGSVLLDATGILDWVPVAVETAAGAARTARDIASDAAGNVMEYGSHALSASGVTSLLHTVGGVVSTVMWNAYTTTETALQYAGGLTESARVKAAGLVEEGKGLKVHCYSPTCTPGKQCYAPTCVRNRPWGGLSLTVGSAQNVVKGLYANIAGSSAKAAATPVATATVSVGGTSGAE